MRAYAYACDTAAAYALSDASDGGNDLHLKIAGLSPWGRRQRRGGNGEGPSRPPPPPTCFTSKQGAENKHVLPFFRLYVVEMDKLVHTINESPPTL